MCKIVHFVAFLSKQRRHQPSKTGSAKLNKDQSYLCQRGIIHLYLQDICSITDHFESFKHDRFIVS